MKTKKAAKTARAKNKKTSEEIKCEMCHKREATCNHYLHFKKKKLKGDHKLKAQYSPKDFKKLCDICHGELHGISPKKSEIRRFVTLYTRTVKARNAIDNQIRSFSRIEIIVPEDFKRLSNELNKKAKEYEKNIQNLLKNGDFPIWEWMKSIKGVSYLLAAKIISYVDIKKTPTISALWSYCGNAPGQKLQKGKKANWNPDLKSYIWQLGDSFVKQRNKKDSFYGQKYNEYRKKYEERGDLTKGQVHAYAMKKTRKLFLAHLWLVWRTMEKLPVTEPYIIGKGEHSNVIPPPNFEMAKKV